MHLYQSASCPTDRLAVLPVCSPLLKIITQTQ